MKRAYKGGAKWAEPPPLPFKSKLKKVTHPPWQTQFWSRVFCERRRLENAENDCSLAGEVQGNYTGYTGGGQAPPTHYSSQGAHQFEFPALRTEFENGVSHPNAQVSEGGKAQHTIFLFHHKWRQNSSFFVRPHLRPTSLVLSAVITRK